MHQLSPTWQGCGDLRWTRRTEQSWRVRPFSPFPFCSSCFLLPLALCHGSKTWKEKGEFQTSSSF